MEFFTTFDRLNLAYSDEGNGLPLLCLAGLTRNSIDFDYLVPHLPPIRLIRMDYRGRGASDWSDDPDSYSVPVETRDVLGLLDHLNIAKAAVLGTSRGGIIAMLLAATAKDRVRGICLNDIGPVIEKAGRIKISGYIGRDPEFGGQAEMAAAMPALMPEFPGVPASRWLQEVENHTVETAGGLKINYDPKLSINYEAVAANPTESLWPLFEAMEGLPLALLRGANSDLLSEETAAEMQRRRPDMTFAEIPDRGHIPFLDEPPAVAAIHNWLEACQ